MRVFVLGIVAWVLSTGGTLPAFAAEYEPVSVEVQLRDAAGAPLAGVEVACVPWETEREPRSTPLEPHEKAVTDPDGICRFEGLTQDAYQLWAVHGYDVAFAQMFPRALEGKAFDLRMKPGRPVYGYVRNAEGEPLEGVVVSHLRRMPLAVSDANGLFTIPVFAAGYDLDLVKEGYAWRSIHAWTRLEIVLERGGVVEGKVVDETGAPLAGATVNYSSGSQHFDICADETGAFRTPGVAPGKKATLRASHETKEAYYRGETTTDVAAGKVRNVSIATTKELRPDLLPPEELAAKRREYEAQLTSVSGKVVHSDTREPVQATIYRANTNSSMGEFDYYKRKAARTAADGTFTLDKLQKGEPLFVRAAPDDPLLFPLEGIVKVEVGDTPVTGLELTGAPGVALSGAAVTAEGQPIVEGDVVLLAPDDRRDEFLGPDNRFSFENLPPGAYTLMLENTSLETGRLEAGQRRDDLVLRLPPKDEGLLVEGVVVDPEGLPVGGVNVALERAEARLHANAETDAAGRFSVRVKEPGVYDVKVWETFSLVLPGQSSSGTGQQLKLSGPAQIQVAPASAVNARLTAIRRPWPQPMLGGTVRDEAGQPVDAEITLIIERYRTERVAAKDGAFLEDRLPEGPFLLEVMAPGYEARVLEAGKDFQSNDRKLAIVLERGPFEEGESVWTQVTRRPATEEAVKAMTFGEYVREREEHYRQRAMPPRPRASVPSPPRPRALQEIQIRAKDDKGNPVRRIVVQRAETVGNPGYPPTPLTARPAAGDSSRILTNDNGEYSVPNGSMVGTEDSAQVLVFVTPDNKSQPPLDITLGPPAPIVIRVRDYDGKPVAKAIVGPPEQVCITSGIEYSGLPESGKDGEVVLDRLPTGDYWFGVSIRQDADPLLDEIRWPMPARLVRVKTASGLKTVQDVTLPRADKGSLEAKIAEWERRVQQGSLRDPEYTETVKALSDREKRRAGKLVAAQLAEIPEAHYFNYQQTLYFVELAAMLGRDAEDAVSEMRRLLASGPATTSNTAVPPNWLSAFAEAIVKLEGTKSISYWAELARDQEAPPLARASASAALGNLGTDKSVKTWLRLRDEARANPGAPPAKERYTHAEKMAEAVIFTASVIPGIPPMQPQLETAWVAEDYQTGRIAYDRNIAHLRRFGNEWLVTDIEAIPVAMP